MNQIKFSKDFNKLNAPSFTTIRRGHNWKLGHDYEIITPTKIFKARLQHAMGYSLKDISDEFLMLDTETESREDAEKLLNSFYDKPIGTKEQIYVLLFFKLSD